MNDGRDRFFAGIAEAAESLGQLAGLDEVHSQTLGAQLKEFFEQTRQKYSV